MAYAITLARIKLLCHSFVVNSPSLQRKEKKKSAVSFRKPYDSCVAWCRWCELKLLVWMFVNARVKLAFPITSPMRTSHTFTRCQSAAQRDRGPELTI